VRRVTENTGKRTPGVDGATWKTPEQKAEAIQSLTQRGYHPLPLRRVYIPKSNGANRPLSIPTMRDRAMQALYLLALDPVSETTADPNSYGFRRGRCTADAIEACFIALCRKDRCSHQIWWIIQGASPNLIWAGFSSLGSPDRPSLPGVRPTPTVSAGTATHLSLRWHYHHLSIQRLSSASLRQRV
jgi:Reverse transcriptase (RNA-dependent DNA polymerase)/N-terminal domain of reverse transcriptase